MENKRLSHEMNVKTKREIDDLQAVLTKTNTEHNKTISVLQAELAERETRIEVLQAENTVRASWWHEKDNSCKKQFEDLNALIVKYQAQIKSLNTDIIARDEKIKDANTEQISTVGGLKNDLVVMANKYNNEVSSLSRQLQETEEVHNNVVSNATIELKNKNDAHTKLMNATMEAHTTDIREITDAHTEMVNVWKETHSKTINELTDAHTMTMNTTNETHTKSINEMTDAHTKVLEEMQSEHAAKIDALLTEKAAEVDRFEKKIDWVKAEMVVQQEAHLALVSAKEVEKQHALTLLRQELEEFVQTADQERENAFLDRDWHKGNYSKERKMRIALHNQLVELQGNIRVICRVRPLNAYEQAEPMILDGGSAIITDILSDTELAVNMERTDVTGAKNKGTARVQKFEFDHVFGPNSTQEGVFEAVQPLCISFLDGFNICIFAYGQTGSGKTFTMEGAGTGVSPRCVVELFDLLQEREEVFSYDLTFSMLQIHNEAIYDLIGNLDTKLTIHQTEAGKFEITDAAEMRLTSAQHALDLIAKGQKNRIVAAHSLNQDSSRSHSIITIKMTGINKIDGSTCSPSKLHLIDLAGSERLGKTGAKGESLVEANSINKSLLALGDVVNALAMKNAHIPYRNSKLTFLLQESLGGSAKVFTFVNISPAQFNSGETVCSLNFAARCRLTNLAKEEDKANKVSTPRNASPINSTSTTANCSMTIKSGTVLTGNGPPIPGASRTPPPPPGMRTPSKSGWNSYSKGSIVL